MELKDKKVLVVGTGISGIGAVKLLNKIGAEVILYDGNEQLTEKQVKEKLGTNEARIVIGSFSECLEEDIALLVISPGVPVDCDIVKASLKKQIPVWGEIELAYHYDKGKIIAITGTNGKTTTTALVGQIVKAHQEKTYIVGNIGKSYTEEVLNTTKDSFTVAEISSFQLETVQDFKPIVSAILNITPDHLNRHKTMENYIATKQKIASKQTKNEVCVLNYDDAVLREFAETTSAQPIYFSRFVKPEKGAYLEDDFIRYTDGNTVETICHIDELKLIGNHNYENVCAAVAITKATGIPTEIIRQEVKEFRAVEHRIEYVATKKDVIYYNDSKGTNPDASIKAIEAMKRPTALIGGGYDKNSEFDSYVQAFQDRIKLLVLIGQTRQKIADTAKKYGFTNVIMAESLEEAVHICEQKTEPGDAVLLSPACASWGMFDNYEQRGKLFKEYVTNL